MYNAKEEKSFSKRAQKEIEKKIAHDRLTGAALSISAFLTVNVGIWTGTKAMRNGYPAVTIILSRANGTGDIAITENERIAITTGNIEEYQFAIREAVCRINREEV